MKKRTRGFPWWAPLAVAAVAAAIAAALTGSASASWEADARLWVSGGDQPTEVYAELLTDPVVVEAALRRYDDSALLDEEHPDESTIEAQALASGTRVELDQTLITVTVEAPSDRAAARLARLLAGAAQDESLARFDDESTLRVLNSSSAPPRRTGPHTARNSAAAAAVGLLGGLVLAASLSGRQPAAASVAGLIGRSGLRPLALIGPGEELSEEGEPPASAVHLADAIEGLEDVSTVMFVPLEAGVGAESASLMAARALAGRERRAFWLDVAAPAFERPELGAPPDWLAGTPGASPLTRAERIGRELERVGARSDVLIVSAGPLWEDAEALSAADRVGAAVVLAVSASATVESLQAARERLGESTLLGVVVEQVDAREAKAFEHAFAEPE